MQPGYQKLKGQDALDYVRYRHGDNDFFRASRQQDFLRQIAHQDAVRAAAATPSKRKELAHIFGRYFEVDNSFVKRLEPDRAGQDRALPGRQSKAPVNEVPFPAYEAKNPAVDSYLYVNATDLRKAVDEFMTGKGASNPRPIAETTQADPTPTAKPSKKHNKPSSITGLEQARTEGENMAVLAETQGHLGFPFYFPALRKTGSRYADSKPRIYSVRDAHGKLHRAYRLVL